MSTNARRAGWVITVLVTLFLAFDAITHLLRVDAVMDFNDKVGAPAWFPVVCGAVLGLSLIAYHLPSTRAMGTVLITAYLGGAVTVNLVFGQPAFNTVFAIAVAVLVWAGAWPRDERLRALVAA
ncbi:FtsH-binding integral membrane protein [Nocardioides luteus]|uniref:Membrane protein n=1 Tax=Nocardioides luteus TaxID=1844 RepID=A0ABQ5T4P9_9ACTN|nr:DoxX family protein [Nocardioides luteus]MDR7308982.1 FtsH-binding integral membrane protein [Nocardioides luteus]GGR71372.1 membrane protein [Nocardioides luteus]GLJ70712.1 membrane protein [Nocardioides luteus]